MTNTTKYLVFRLGPDPYAIPLLSVREVSSPLPLRTVPDSAEFFLGVATLRDQVLSVIALNRRFGLPESESEGTEAILVFRYGDAMVGALVDEVLAVRTFDDDQVDRNCDVRSPVPPEFRIGVANVDGAFISVIRLAEMLEQETTLTRDALEARAI